MIVASLDKIENLKFLKKVDFIEIRDDLIELKDIEKLKIKKKVILTFKKRKKDKIFQFLKYLEKNKFFFPCFIDLDYKVDNFFLKKIKKNFPKLKIIISYHNMKKTPKYLDKIFYKMKKFDADIYKMCCFANSSLDSLRMLLFMKDKKNFCGLCMGEKGVITRILASQFKSVFNYCKIGEETASSQLSLDILKKRYKYDRFNKNRKIYCLIGDTTFSPSHITHNKIFSFLNVNAVYLKIFLEKKEIWDFFKMIKHLPVEGMSITMPLKEEILKLPFISHKNLLSVNTLNKKEGRWKGYNTDGEGVICALEKRVEIKDKKVFILGAGGAAKAIAIALFKKKAKIILCNRSKERVEKLSKILKCQYFLLKEMDVKKEDYDILINTVPETHKQIPILKKYVFFKKIIVDINICDSLLLKEAKKKKCKVINGFEIFIYQAKEQFKIWFKDLHKERV
ncbi:MAG: hypothetical protein AMS24_04540 [Chlamydiae bacterium SM23_39]|nr:MAG: hypothetical protein AMS24_04540 [Chlamydiae bacterium SM23_39]